MHRIGRTGRAGSKGQAISFVSREEERALSNIEKLIGERITRIKLPGYSVGNRDKILSNLAEKSTRTKSNRMSKTTIISNKSRSAKDK